MPTSHIHECFLFQITRRSFAGATVAGESLLIMLPAICLAAGLLLIR